MFRVKKANGWNRYKLQKRFMFIFWFDVKCMTFFSKASATVKVIILNKGG